MKIFTIVFVVGVLTAGALHAGKTLPAKPVGQCTNRELMVVIAKNTGNAIKEVSSAVAGKVQSKAKDLYAAAVDLQATPAGRVTCTAIGTILVYIAAVPLKK
jgi:hypothetical protein